MKLWESNLSFDTNNLFALHWTRNTLHKEKDTDFGEKEVDCKKNVYEMYMNKNFARG